MQSSFGSFPSENRPFFPTQEPRKIYENRRISMKTGLTKKQKTTDVYYNAKDPLAEVYTYDTNLNKRYGNTQPNIWNCASKLTMMGKVVCGSRSTRAGSASG